MAGTVQSDPYKRLTRKIGYSVGLEFLAERVLRLVDLYVVEKEITFTSWTQLVEGYGRGKGLERATVEFANVFGELNLIRLIGREVQVLPGLDTLAILKRYFDGRLDQFERAYRVILLYFLIEADGDIFLNCLGGSFSSESVKTNLETMVSCKWERFCKVIRNPSLQRKVWDSIGIKSDRGGAKTRKTTSSPFAPRGGPSPFEGRRESVFVLPEKNVSIDSSYLSKVLPTRKGWATNLNLYTKGKLTETGSRLLSEIAELGLTCNGKGVCIWPYEGELLALNIKPAELGIPLISDWILLSSIARALEGISATTSIQEDSTDSMIDTLEDFYQLYRTGSKARGSIRHQLPVYVAKPLVVGAAAGNRQSIPPLMDIVDQEARSARRRVTITHIRGTEGALVFKGK